ncbi:MAG TPA: 5'-methylthioadenosine/S-adenosylhomocysteine nucleosidase [Bryobacteraceae bacterium]|nr:5'-methylthioadenosine/S-adenosylhomocysteine nucleosidase [Bryobacteraceae bacterium]
MLRRSFLSACAACAIASADDPAPVLVQGAIDVETESLLAVLEDRRVTQISAWTFWEGRIGARRVVVSRTDVGPINAVAATVLGIERYKPELVINQGTAGAHNPSLRLWDIVIGERTVDYGAYTSQHADAGSGVHPERWKPDPHRLRVDGKQLTSFPTFSGDARTIEAAMAIKNPRGRVLRGTIGSAYQFNRELDMIAALRAIYGTDSEDMESAFAHGAAVGLRTRFLAIRMISDSEYSHPTFERVAGQYCGEFVVELLRKLP